MQWTLLGFIVSLAILCLMESLSAKKEEMTILFAVAGSPLACFAEGAILAASVYLVSRGVKNPLRNSKK